MSCWVCTSPVAEGATVCARCGTSLDQGSNPIALASSAPPVLAAPADPNAVPTDPSAGSIASPGWGAAEPGPAGPQEFATPAELGTPPGPGYDAQLVWGTGGPGGPDVVSPTAKRAARVGCSVALAIFLLLVGIAVAIATSVFREARKAFEPFADVPEVIASARAEAALGAPQADALLRAGGALQQVQHARTGSYTANLDVLRRGGLPTLPGAVLFIASASRDAYCLRAVEGSRTRWIDQSSSEPTDVPCI